MEAGELEVFGKWRRNRRAISNTWGLVSQENSRMGKKH